MSSSAGSSTEILPVAVPERTAALELLLCDWNAEDRARQIAEFLQSPGPAANWETLVAAYRGGKMVGVAWGQIHPGRVAGCWPPRTVPGTSAVVRSMLLEAVCEKLGAQQVQLAQSLLLESQRTDGDLLRRHGFTLIATLEYLFSVDRDFPTAPPAGDLEFMPYSPELHPRLLEIVEATYQQTLDCPQINGVRAIEDVLSGYRASGAFDPRFWLLVRHATEDVGCLLLADYPEYGHQELVYMGLRQQCRGRHWGAQMARHAQWVCRQTGRTRLVLAVDAANAPARRMYQAAGFRAWDRRVAYLKILERKG
jgi:GNAT superfamily N-acetyltransferase